MTQPYALQHQDQGDRLEIAVTGVWSPDTAPAILTDILALLTALPHARLLVDMRAVKDLTEPEDNAVFAEALGQMFQGQLAKAAVVDLEENRANNDMLEAAARRQGINARFFYDHAAALRWLAI